MRRLTELLRLLSGSEFVLCWNDPVMLSDEVIVLSFRTASLGAGRFRMAPGPETT